MRIKGSENLAFFCSFCSLNAFMSVHQAAAFAILNARAVSFSSGVFKGRDKVPVHCFKQY